ncbi:16 kDa phloem protein 2-like [Rutidosis leptorrhynchoides]|uniref:16 kDa phloem protein 2-like n=1 Tax=Rutidosis leptorrhynchoides TaxID=125765 RepID=UPI003A99C2BF
MPTGKIQVLLVSAKGLHDTDFFNKMDPYATITCRTQEQKSNVASGQGSSPEWNETFEFSVTGEVPELVIKIKDSDVGTEDDDVGEAKIPLEPLFLARSIPPTAYNVVINDEFCGEVKVGLEFIPDESHEYEHGHERGHAREHGHGHHEEDRSYGGWKESSY